MRAGGGGVDAPDHRETAVAIDDAAARWIVARDAAPHDAALAAQIAEWAAADPRRRGALLRAEAAWAALAGEAKEASRTGRRGFVAAAAAAAFAGIGAGSWWWQGRDPAFETQVGERRRIALADGSAMVLNTASRTRVALAPAARRIALDRGEAWFQVAHDPARPFVVAAGDIRVEAVGTAFAVRRVGDSAEVTVTEGRVRAWSQASPARFLTIAAGQRATLAERVGATPGDLHSGGTEEALAWRQGEIVLDGRTLGDAAAEFNRYNRRQLAVETPLAERRMVGRFRTDDVEGFARSAAAVAGGRIEEGAATIRIVE